MMLDDVSRILNCFGRKMLMIGDGIWVFYKMGLIKYRCVDVIYYDK